MSHSFRQITPTDHFGWHAAYLEVYEKLFAPMREYAPLALLEIGTDGGGGLRCYKDYFHGDALIVGVDISPAPDVLKDQEIRHHQEDAYSPDFLALLSGKYGHFEVIIDDGPHTIGSQEFFVQNYPNLLSSRPTSAHDGIAIVEDIQEPGHAPHLASLVPEGFFSMVVDLRHVNGRYDDLLLVIFRK